MTKKLDDLLVGGPAIAAYLGCSVPQLYKAAKRKQLPVSHDGWAWTARKSELDKVLASWRKFAAVSRPDPVAAE